MKSMPVYRFSLPNQYNLILVLQVRYTKYLMWWYPTACTPITFLRCFLKRPGFASAAAHSNSVLAVVSPFPVESDGWLTSAHWPSLTGLQIKKSRTGASDSSPAGRTLRLQNYQNANANHSHFGVTPTHPLSSHQSLSQSLGHWSGYEFNINLKGERNPFRIPWHTSNLDLLGYENKETRWQIYPQAQNQFGLGGRFLW